MAAPLPPAMQSLKKFLKAAEQFEQRAPVVAYACRLFASKAAVEKFAQQRELKGNIIQLLDETEKAKAALKGNEALGNEVVLASIVSETALKLFTTADTADREGRADKRIALAFSHAAVLFEVLTLFEEGGQLDPETQQRLKYARWKAAYISRCISQGITPTPGPVGLDGMPLDGGEDETARPAAAMGGPASDEWGYAPEAAAPPAAPPAAPMAFPPQPTQTPLYPPEPTMHVPPAQPKPSLASATTPPPPAHKPTPTPQPQPQPHAVHYAPSPAPQPVYQPPPLQAAHQSPSPAAAAARAPTSGGSRRARHGISMQDSDQATRFCKFAISALQYDDNQTAVDNLLKALALLSE